MLAVLLVAVVTAHPEAQPKASSALAIAVADRCLFAQALEILSQSPPADRDSAESQELKARLLIQLERGAEAAEILDRIRGNKAGPGGAERLFLLGLAQSLSADASAEKTLITARQAGADKELVDGAIASLRIRQGRLAEAETLLRSILKNDPAMPGPLYNLACLRAMQGHIAEAAALIRMSWEAGLKNPDKLHSDPALSAVRAWPGLIDDLTASQVRRCRTY